MQRLMKLLYIIEMILLRFLFFIFIYIYHKVLMLYIGSME